MVRIQAPALVARFALLISLCLSTAAGYAATPRWENIGTIDTHTVYVDVANVKPPTQAWPHAFVQWIAQASDGTNVTATSNFDCEREAFFYTHRSISKAGVTSATYDYLAKTVATPLGVVPLTQSQMLQQTQFPAAGSAAAHALEFVCQSLGNLPPKAAQLSVELRDSQCKANPGSFFCNTSDALTNDLQRQLLWRTSQVRKTCKLTEQMTIDMVMQLLDGAHQKCTGAQNKHQCAVPTLSSAVMYLGDDLSAAEIDDMACHNTRQMVSIATERVAVANSLKGFRACVRDAASVLTDLLTPADAIAKAILQGCRDKLAPSFFDRADWVRDQLSEITGLVLATRAAQAAPPSSQGRQDGTPPTRAPNQL